jgi:MFS family permease
MMRIPSFMGFNKLAGFPLPIWFLGLGCFINISGLSLLWPVNAIYVHIQLHQPMTMAGIVLMIYSGSGFFGSFIGGWMYDRFGAIKVLVIGLLIGAISILVPAFNHSWVVYIFIMVIFGIACAIPFPVLSSLAGHAWPEGGRSAFNFLYVANNLGVALGTALGGFLAETSFKSVFIGICVAYSIFTVLVLTLFRRPFNDIYYRATHKKEHKDETPRSTVHIPWGALSALFLGFIVSWAVYVQWQVVISVYMQSIGYSLASYSVLWTLNGILIFVSQPLVSIVVKRFPSFTVQMIGGVLLFGLSFAVLVYFRQYSAFVIAMILTTLGEIFVWPAVPAAVAEVSPPSRIGMLQGLVGSAATFGRMLGPLAGGILYDHGSVHLVLLCSIFTLIVPMVLFLLFRRLSAIGSEHIDACTTL